MKIAIYSPYLDTLGGGEKYMMTIAEIFSAKGIVDVLLDENLASKGVGNLRNLLESRFNLDLSRVSFVKAPIGINSSFIQRNFFMNKYDLLFFLTDGSLFYPTAKKNILHIQSPIKGQPAKSLWGKIKLAGWDLIIYNSEFTKANSLKNWPKKSEVIYPPVDVENLRLHEKKKNILNVGRFFSYLKDKKQDLLIDAFRSLYNLDVRLRGWSLHLAGSASDGDKAYIEELKIRAKGLPVFFYPNIEFEKLLKLYGESSIYWHAAGFGEDDPTKMEHFGISTVEAMSAGCVPIVVNKGGQKEIVEEGETGFLWDSIEQLKDYTLKVIKDEKIFDKLSKNSIISAKKYSKANFKANILKIAS